MYDLRTFTNQRDDTGNRLTDLRTATDPLLFETKSLPTAVLLKRDEEQRKSGGKGDLNQRLNSSSIIPKVHVF